MSIDAASTALAEAILTLGRPNVNKLWATVTSVSPLLVRFDSAAADVGPLPYIRGKPKLYERVLVLVARDGSKTVVGTTVAAGAAMLLCYVRRGPTFAYRPWLARVGIDDTIALEEIASGLDADATYVFDKHSSPHLFPMTDGAIVALLNRPQHATPGYNYAIRSSGGSWSAVTLFASDASFAFNEADAHFVQHGDVIYAFLHGYQPPTTSLHRLAYSAGTITDTSVDLTNLDAQTNGIYGYGIYYDSANDLIHIWYGDADTGSPPTTNWIAAYNATTLAFVYRTAGPAPAAFDFVGDGTDIDGDGATFFCGSMKTVGLSGADCRIHRVVATGSGHTVTQESGVTLPTDVARWAAFVWDGQNLTIVAFYGGVEGIEVLQRLGTNSYGSWVNITDTSAYRAAYNDFGVQRLGPGDVAVFWDWNPTSGIERVSYRRRVGGSWGPYVTVEDTSGGLFDTFIPSSGRLPIATP